MSGATATSAAVSWSAASRPVWALVSGLPRQQREARLMLMMQAYIDDSGIGEPPLALLAGFVSSAARWAHFSQEWDAALARHGLTSPFKMRDAQNLKFRGWSAERINNLIDELIDIIKRYVLFGVVSWVATEDFRSYYKRRMKKGTTTEYLLLFYGLFQCLHERAPEFGVRQKIDIILDEQGWRQLALAKHRMFC